MLQVHLKEIQGYKLIGQQSYGERDYPGTDKLIDGPVLKYTYAKWYTPKV